MRNAVLFGSTPVRSRPDRPISMDTGRKPVARRTASHQKVLLSGTGTLLSFPFPNWPSRLPPSFHSLSLPAQSEQPPSEASAPPEVCEKTVSPSPSSWPNGQRTRSGPRIPPGSERNGSENGACMTLASGAQENRPACHENGAYMTLVQQRQATRIALRPFRKDPAQRQQTTPEIRIQKARRSEQSLQRDMPRYRGNISADTIGQFRCAWLSGASGNARRQEPPAAPLLPQNILSRIRTGYMHFCASGTHKKSSRTHLRTSAGALDTL